MQVYQFRIKVELKKTLSVEDIQPTLAGFIDQGLAQNEQMLLLHNTNTYKNYTFDGFHPIEMDKIYPAGKRYVVTIRMIDYDLAKFFEQVICKSNNQLIKTVGYEKKMIAQKQIEKIYSITPCIIKDDRGYWKRYMNEEEFIERIKINLIKKYNQFTQSTLNEDFQLFTSINIKNKVPVSAKYKDITLLGDKIECLVENNRQAQELAYMALGTGILEMNSRGYGFINFRYL